MTATDTVDRAERPQRPERDQQLHAILRGAAALTAGAVGQLSSLGLLATSAWLITTSSLRPPILTLTVAIAAVRLFAPLRGLGRYGERLAAHDLALRVLARIRVWSFRRLERLMPGGLGAISEGDVLSRVVADVDAVQDLLVGIALPIATGLLTASVAVALEALMVPGAGQLLAAGLVLDGIVVPLIGWRLGVRAASSLAAARGRVATVVVESLHGAADLVAFGARDHALGTLDGAEQTLARGLRRSASASGWAQALGGVVAGATTIGIVALGSSAVAHRAGALGHPSPVAVAVAAFVSLAAFDAIAAMPDAVVRLHTALGAAHRIRELDTRTPPVASPDAPRPIRAGDDTYVLKDVSVPYAPDGPAVLEHIDLEITPGKRLAVVGTSGAGKTTLALALLRFLDIRTGRATYGGYDVRDVAPDDIRARIAWAPQDPHIFGTTVAANLRVARPDASDDELVAVLVALGLDEWLAQLPGGLATEVGERGQRMSGGGTAASGRRSGAPGRSSDPAARRADRTSRRGARCHGPPGRASGRPSHHGGGVDHPPLGRRRRLRRGRRARARSGRRSRARRRPAAGRRSLGTPVGRRRSVSLPLHDPGPGRRHAHGRRARAATAMPSEAMGCGNATAARSSARSPWCTATARGAISCAASTPRTWAPTRRRLRPSQTSSMAPWVSSRIWARASTSSS